MPAAHASHDPRSQQTPGSALASLRGHAKDFAKSNVTFDALATAIALAQGDGATAEQIAAAVAEGGADAVEATEYPTGEGRYHFS